MASRYGSVSRSLLASARASTRTPSSLPRFRPAPTFAPRPQSRRLPFASMRNFGELGCTQSLLPLHSLASGGPLMSHLSANLRAFCELSHGRAGKDG